jgi:YD repeat-containing protein
LEEQRCALLSVNRIDVTGTITEPNIDRVEVTPNGDAGKKKMAQMRGGFFIARGIELNDSTTNQVKAEAFDDLGKHADTTNTNITLETSVDIRYTYDDNGNLTQKNDYSTGTLKTTTYVYNNADRLIQVNLPDNKWEKYYYDGLGRRYKVEVNDGQTTATKQYVFAGGFIIRELDGAASPTLAREYIGDGRRVLYGKDGQNNFYYAHYDRDINVSSITNGSGNEVTFYEYDAFGNLMAMAGADVLGIGFASGRLAAGSNMLFVGTGYYDP